MFKWKKLGKIFDPTEIKGKKWMQEFSIAPCSLIFDDFVRVYFSCRPERDKDGQYVSYSAFVDLDRKNLFNIINIAKKPIMTLGELGCFDEHGTYPVSVIKNNTHLLAYYGGWSRCESVPFTVQIGLAESYDNGITFIKAGNGPLLSSNANDPFVISGPKVKIYNNVWYMSYVAVTKWLENDGKPEAIYKIRIATSKDGIEWNRDSKDIIPNKIEDNECQASPDIFYYKGKYHMFFCYHYALDFRLNDRGYKIGYAYSNDMINWIRDDSQVGIDLSEEGWDSQSMAYPHLFKLDNNIYMLYIGNEVGRYGFGIAKLEKYV